MKLMLPIVGALLACLAVLALFLFKQGLDDYLAAQSLAAVEIAAPAGAEVVPYDATQGLALTGHRFDLDPEAIDPTNGILRRFASSAAGVDDGVAQVFVQGDERVALSLHRVAQIDPPETLASRLGLEDPIPRPRAAPDIFGTVAGFEVVHQPDPRRLADQPPPTYRHFTASIGASDSDMVEITVLTNASDAFVASVLDGIDMVGLNDRLPKPDPLILPDAGFVPVRSGPLSRTPPPPTPAHLAYRLLNSADPLSAIDRAVLERVLAGELSDMEGLQAQMRDLAAPTPAMVAVLGEPSPETAARFAAVGLLQSGRLWSQNEVSLLSRVAVPGSTQADLDQISLSDESVSPEVLALVAQLPGAPAGD